MKPKIGISDDIRQEIQLRAYFIWERQGRPQGREAEHWSLAEAEILSEKPAPKAKKPVQKEASQKSKTVKPEGVTKPAAKKKKAVKTKTPKAGK